MGRPLLPLPINNRCLQRVPVRQAMRSARVPYEFSAPSWCMRNEPSEGKDRDEFTIRNALRVIGTHTLGTVSESPAQRAGRALAPGERAMASLTADQVRRTPAYTMTEAAHYLRVPVTTLRAWCTGQDYHVKGQTRRYQRVICLDGSGREGLSFLNLIEAHVLSGLRRVHHLPLPRIRRTLDWVSKQLNLSRPLAEAKFATDGINLYVDHISQLIDVDKGAQIAMREIIESYLARVERDPAGIPIKLYPFTRKEPAADTGRGVVIDPTVAFGRPVLAGTRVPTAILADRFKAGDALQELADDYRTTSQAIEEALRCELNRREAA